MSKRVRKEKSYTSDSDEMTRMIKVFLFVLLAFGAFYLIFAIARGEISFGGKKEKEVEIQNIEILAGESFNRTDSEYYVLFFDFKEDKTGKYEHLYNMYVNKTGSKNLYLVDLSKKFNANYLAADASGVVVKSVDELKVVDGTIIKISSGNVSTYKVGYEEVKTLLFG